MNKHTNDSNRRMFAPFALRDLAPSEKVGSEPTSYVKLDGLGKIAYSSIKRPKPLMDMIAQPVTPHQDDEVSRDIPVSPKYGFQLASSTIYSLISKIYFLEVAALSYPPFLPVHS